MGMEMAVYFLIIISCMFIFGRAIFGSLKLIKKIVVNSILGVVLLIITNVLGASIGIGIGFNLITILIAGFLGVPGVLFMIIFKYFL